jgi:cell division protein FtsN
VAGALAAWFGVRAVRAPAPVQPRAEPVAPSPAKQNAPVTPPSQSPAAALAPSATAPASAAPDSPLAPAAAAPSAPAGEAFEIVVASFRTETRAEAVVEQVGTLNLPVRRRVADGWQQVILGPFRSRADADAARQQLDQAGLTGAQIVPINR